MQIVFRNTSVTFVTGMCKQGYITTEALGQIDCPALLVVLQRSRDKEEIYCKCIYFT